MRWLHTGGMYAALSETAAQAVVAAMTAGLAEVEALMRGAGARVQR
ncbi:hypothetical protein [Dactylosporangium sp. NPDC000521]